MKRPIIGLALAYAVGIATFIADNNACADQVIAVDTAAATTQQTTTKVGQATTLEGRVFRHTQPKDHPTFVWGNGATPDLYIPNRPYLPNPPANRAIHTVTSNSR